MGVAEVINNILSPVLDPVLNIHPFWGLLILTFILNIIITLAYKYLTDQELLKSIKAETKEMQKQMKELKDQPDKLMALQKRSLERSMESFKQSLKPMLITTLPLIAVMGYLSVYYAEIGNPKLFLIFGWIGTYIIFSLVFNLGLRKLLKVH